MQGRAEDLEELDVDDESGDGGGLVRGLLEALGGVRGVPVLVVAFDGEVDVEAVSAESQSVGRRPRCGE